MNLAPDLIAQTTVTKVERPECGAMRTLHAQGTIPLKLKELEEKCWKSGEIDVGAQFIAPAWEGDAAHRAQ